MTSTRCKDCLGTAADWIRDEHGVHWTVVDIDITGRCRFCRRHPGHGLKPTTNHETRTTRC